MQPSHLSPPAALCSPTPVDPSGVATRIHELAARIGRSAPTRPFVLAVASDDGALHVRAAAGSATTTDPYFIASTTKMFTAAMAVQLVDEGAFTVDDRLVDLVPHLDVTGIHRVDGVDRTGHIRLRHLLHQTSGLPDYFAGGVVEDLKAGRDRSYTIEDVVEVARAAPAAFPPGDRDGTRSAYSDTNYQLLTAVIEAATGVTYARALEQRITRPLGLTGTYVAGSPPSSAPSEPLTLHHRDRALHLPDALASEQGAGGVVSTLDDQLRFSRAFHGGELFSAAHHPQMRRWNRLVFPLGYGYGLMRYRLPRWMTPLGASPELVGHSGATNSFAFHAPQLRCHIVGTLNQLDNPSRAFRVLSKVAAIVRRAEAHRR